MDFSSATIYLLYLNYFSHIQLGGDKYLRVHYIGITHIMYVHDTWCAGTRTCWARSTAGTRAHIVYITRIAWWCHERNLILMNHELFTGDAPITEPCYRACVISRRVPDVAGPTCLWSYWWHQWAHNNWSDSTKRSVTDCPLRGARVACDPKPVRESIHDTYIFIDILDLFGDQFDRNQCIFRSVCASSLDELTWSAE